MNSTVRNIAYIDGQNLYMGTSKSEPCWHVDLARFRVYLDKKYNVGTAYYYLGYLMDGQNELYETLRCISQLGVSIVIHLKTQVLKQKLNTK